MNPLNKNNKLAFLATIGFVFILLSSQVMWVTFSPVVTYVAKELNTSVEFVGLLAVTYPTLFLILTIPSGILLDRNFKFWLIFGTITTFLGSIIRYAFINYWWFFFAQLLGAIGQPFLLNGIVPFASKLFEERRRTLIISVLSSSMYLGATIALGTGATLYSIGGILLLMSLSAAFGILGFILLVLFIMPLKIMRNESEEKQGSLKNMDIILKRRDLWFVGLILGLGVAAFDNLSTWLQPALSSIDLGNIAGEAVAISIILGLINTIIIPRYIAKKNARATYLRIATLSTSILFIILAIMANSIFIFLLLGMSGILMIPGYSIIMDWISKFTKKDIHGNATGFVGLISRIISVSLTYSAVLFIVSSRLYFSFLAISVILAFLISMMLPSDKKIEEFMK